MIKPSLNEFSQLASKGNLIPVYQEILADMETPLSVLNKLSSYAENTFLMESVEHSEHLGRYSFLGTNPRALIRFSGQKTFIEENGKTIQTDIEDNPLDILKKYLARYKPVKISKLPPLIGGAIGYMGYGMVHHFDAILQENPDDLFLDDACFMIIDTLIVFDHAMNKFFIISNAHVSSDTPLNESYEIACKKISALRKILESKSAFSPCVIPENLEEKAFASNMTQNEYEQAVVTAKKYIKAGDIFQVVLSQRFHAPTSASAVNIYRALRSINPSPYMFFLHFKDFYLIGSSPEIMVRCEHGRAEVRPIAGTRKRGYTHEEDQTMEQELLADPKERAEHVMLVDLGRNDLGRVCVFNSVKVPENEFMIIERYSHVMHIVSDVVGKLKEDCDVFDLVRACFPAGTVSGAPKIPAMQIIDELEKNKRGHYAGAVGYFSFDGNLDTAITIRTILLKDSIAYIQAGAGIVADSDPAMEYLEKKNKVKGMFKAITFAEHIERGQV